MRTDVIRGLRFTVVTMALFGGGYHLLIWGVGQALFPAQAAGSLIRAADGRVVGSSLLAQQFTRPEYFRSRPSGVDYNAASTGGTNFGPSNADHLKAVEERLRAAMGEEHVVATAVPSEMVTASGGGLDPHIPPAAAELQAPRIAGARHVAVGRVRDLIRAHTEPPALGIFGRARINVLRLNLALDELGTANLTGSATRHPAYVSDSRTP